MFKPKPGAFDGKAGQEHIRALSGLGVAFTFNRASCPPHDPQAYADTIFQISERPPSEMPGGYRRLVLFPHEGEVRYSIWYVPQ